MSARHDLVAPAVAAAILTGVVLAVVRFGSSRPPAPAATAAAPASIGRSVSGVPIPLITLGSGPRTVVFMASIHGSEGAGTPLLERLAAHVREKPALVDGLTLHLLPAANPDGLRRGNRLNRRGVDLNRNFPADNREDRARFGHAPLSEPESRALHDFILATRPALIVSIHQPFACIDWDGPPATAALARRLAAASGLPVRKLGARPGSLGAWFGETMGGSILTMELPRPAQADPDALWAAYGPGLLSLLAP